MNHMRIRMRGGATVLALAVGASALLGGVLLGTGGASAGTSASATVAVTGAPGASVPVGNQFAVDIDITAFTPGTGSQATWGGYLMKLDYDEVILEVQSVVAGSVAGCDPPISWAAPPQMTLDVVITGCSFQSSTETGTDATITFECVANGTSQLHLVTLAEDPAEGTTLFDPGAVNIPTALVDASVTCGTGVGVPTNTPTATSTPSATNTATGGQATQTARARTATPTNTPVTPTSAAGTTTPPMGGETPGGGQPGGATPPGGGAGPGGVLPPDTGDGSANGVGEPVTLLGLGVAVLMAAGLGSVIYGRSRARRSR